MSGWRKSTRSKSANCVETASGSGGVLVRDTADRGGPVIAFPAGAWAAFTRRCLTGELTGSRDDAEMLARALVVAVPDA
jgi:hypothetical protein